MTNRELYFRDPTTLELLNNGVSKVSEIGTDESQIRTLRFELETFVCDGEYARGLERILRAYLDGLGREEQKAVWVSGFFGSGKSHLVCTAPGFLDTRLRYAAWRSSYCSRASLGVRYASFSRRQHWL